VLDFSDLRFHFRLRIVVKYTAIATII
jgi:hypothetical protein